MELRIVGSELPGTTCDDGRDDTPRYENVHVGVQRKQEVVSLVRGDADSATWDVELDVVPVDGGLDYRGPFVQGRKGDRFLYLSWGMVDDDCPFTMFRRAKLMLDTLDDRVARDSERPGHRLVARLGLSDGCGLPRCAAVRPPDIAWTAEPT